MLLFIILHSSSQVTWHSQTHLSPFISTLKYALEWEGTGPDAALGAHSQQGLGWQRGEWALCSASSHQQPPPSRPEPTGERQDSRAAEEPRSAVIRLGGRKGGAHSPEGKASSLLKSKASRAGEGEARSRKGTVAGFIHLYVCYSCMHVFVQNTFSDHLLCKAVHIQPCLQAPLS